MALDPKLLEILACPYCRSELFEVNDAIYCVNEECRRVYAVKDDIPIMLIDEATVLELDTWEKIMDEHDV